MSAYSGRDDGLFHAAAAESQSFGAQLTIAESQYQYDALVSRVNCSSASDTLQCLRSVDIKILAQNNINIPTPGGAGKTPLFMYSNVIDGNFTTDYTYKLFAEGKFVHVPSIFGDDTNEGTIFTPSQINNVTEMNAFLKNNFVKLTSEQLAQIDNLYPNSSTTQYPGRGSYWRTAATAYGEMRYNCPGINISSTIAAANVPSYNYHWDVLSSVNANNGLGVTHTAELGSIWGTSVSPERALNPTIQAYWTSFLRTKDPNTYKLASAPTWEVFGTTGSGPRMHFVNALGDVGMENVDQGQMERCAYLSGIGIALGQ
jgi:carboxylesterase type B